MKRKLFIILGVLVLSTNLVLSFIFKKENNITSKGISRVEKILSKPDGIQAYTLNGEKTDLSYSDLISGYVIDTIACKNGTVATYNFSDNTITLSNIHMPDYCTMDFKKKATIYSQIIADNPTISTRTDFSTTFTTTNTGTLYKATESIAGSAAKDVYYFAGDAKNNWVKFAGFYWRIIRTNHDGSVRLLYSGTSPDTTKGFIETSAFNSSYNDSMYVGYKYGTSGTLASNRTNENDSSIKRDIDNWYSNNLSNYTKYLSTEAVYCNDREVGSGTYSATGSKFNYAPYTRLDTNKAPSYNCTNSKDAFSGSNAEAKLTYPIALMTADEITYAGGKPATSLTSPYAWYYTNSTGGSITGDAWWWLLSPGEWSEGTAEVWYVEKYGRHRLYSAYVAVSLGVRPVISLKGDLIWKSGDGSSESPYEVIPLTLYETILTDNPTISTRTDFSTTYTEINTGTLFKSTESIAGSEAKDVYYFAGDVDNNWVKFGGFYWRIIRTNHDGSVRLLYSGTATNTTEGYIGESAFNNTANDSMYVGYMYGTSGSLDNNRTNTNNSTIKTYIENWYSNNISNYTKYISTEAVYCNDREIGNGTYSATGSEFQYAPYTRLYTNNANPTYNCTNSKDAFSGSNTEAKLTYPIGLMTADEITYAGGYINTDLSDPFFIWYYLNGAGDSITGSTYWWLLSPAEWYEYSASWFVNMYPDDNKPGFIEDSPVFNSYAVRPVISIKQCALWSSGNGSSSSPYEVNGGC